MEKTFNKIKLETRYIDGDTGLDVAAFKIKGQYSYLIVDKGPNEDMEEYEKEVSANFDIIPQILFLYENAEEFNKAMKEISDRQKANPSSDKQTYIPYPILKADDFYSLYGNSESDETVIPEAFISGTVTEAEEKDTYFAVKFKSCDVVFETTVKKETGKPDPAVGNIVYGKFELHTEIKK